MDRFAGSHGAYQPSVANREEGKEETEQAVEGMGNGREKLEVSRFLQGTVMRNIAELGDDPGRQKGKTGHGGTGCVHEVGKIGARNPETVRHRASHSSEHEGVGESIEEAEETETKDTGEEPLSGAVRDLLRGMQQPEEPSGAFDNRSEGAEQQGEQDGAEVPWTGEGSPQASTPTEPSGKRGPVLEREENQGTQTGGGKGQGCLSGCKDKA
jgi:hypothetical protein